MPIKIQIPTVLRQHTKGSTEVQVSVGTVGQALNELTSKYSGLRKYLFSEQGEIRQFVNVYVNDKDIRYMKGTETSLNEGDTLLIIPAVSGGIRNA